MVAIGVILLASACGGVVAETERARWTPPPVDTPFDYQIGGDYPLPDGVGIVIRDWFAGRPVAGRYSICYVNGFQTQPDEGGVDRPDERTRWPRDLVLRALGDDPQWGGEYLIDISTPDRRRRAAEWIAPMLDTCARKGFRAVEIDNLDSWTRFDGTPLAARVPFDVDDAVDYARRLVRLAHQRGLAVGQKNTPNLDRRTSRTVIGFDFAVAEQCGRFRECSRYIRSFDRRVLDVEYDRPGYRRACSDVGNRIAVILRDVDVTRPGSTTYRYASCS